MEIFLGELHSITIHVIEVKFTLNVTKHLERQIFQYWMLAIFKILS